MNNHQLFFVTIIATIIVIIICSIGSSTSTVLFSHAAKPTNTKSSHSNKYPDFKAMMPSVLHLTREGLKSGAQQRCFVQSHKPSFFLIHLPRHPAFHDGKQYQHLEELGKRIGSFVSVMAMNGDEDPHMVEEGFKVESLPSFRLWPQGDYKRMEVYVPQQLRNKNKKKRTVFEEPILVDVDEAEDYVLDEMIQTNATLVYDYLNLEDYPCANSEEDDDSSSNSDSSSSSLGGDLILEDGLLKSNNNNKNKNMNNQQQQQQEEGELSPQELQRRRKCMQKKQDRELREKISKVSRRKAFVFSIILPANPSPSFMFAEEDTIQKQVRRLESIIHIASIHRLVKNNLVIAVVKDEDENMNDEIRVKLEIITMTDSGDADGAVSVDADGTTTTTTTTKLAAVVVDKTYTLDELTERETSTQGNRFLADQIKLRIPFPLEWYQIAKVMMDHVKCPYPEELKPGEEVITKIDRFEFWNQVYKYVEEQRGTPESEIQEFPRKNTNYFIRYRPVLDTCKTLRECFSNESIPNSIPFIVRQTPEFKEPPSNLKSVDDILKTFTSKKAAKVMVEGALPHNDYLRESLQSFAKRWSPTGDDFNVNLFQSHVDRKTFPFKLPKEFDEFFPQEELENNKNSTRPAVNVRLSPQFSFKGASTIWHSDPPAHGGGYLHLVHGKKFWKFMTPKHQALVKAVTDNLSEFGLKFPERFLNLSTPDEIVVRKNENEENEEDHYFDMWGGELRAGDTVVFPPGGLHRVWTGDDENTIGVVGYTLIQSNKESTLWKEIKEFGDNEEQRAFKQLVDFRYNLFPKMKIEF